MVQFIDQGNIMKYVMFEYDIISSIKLLQNLKM